ncbi:unnamed protein product [Brugia timori]|uniref:Ovule protein n=1 Tax=Brugia timori TaxID=42155 RepID=A0A0R3QIS6_9BILA|nr:unnamed protein product [Brugia timori]
MNQIRIFNFCNSDGDISNVVYCSFVCCVTRTKVARFESSFNFFAPVYVQADRSPPSKSCTVSEISPL